jgi:hypothetical protein
VNALIDFRPSPVVARNPRSSVTSSCASSTERSATWVESDSHSQRRAPFLIDTGWRRGLGDVAAAVKHAFHHSLERGRIFAAAAEIILPTGKENEGLGGGVTVFEPFAAFGQLLPADGFIQAQTGFEIPFDQNRSNEFFWRGLVGKSFVEGNG